MHAKIGNSCEQSGTVRNSWAYGCDEVDSSSWATEGAEAIAAGVSSSRLTRLAKLLTASVARHERTDRPKPYVDLRRTAGDRAVELSLFHG
jgi:hypothetical protein